IIVVALNDHNPAAAFQTGMAIVGFFISIVPGLVVGFIWPKRWLTVGYEAVLPWTRRRFIFASGLAMLLDQLALWVACQAFSWAAFGAAFLLLHDSSQPSPIALDGIRDVLIIILFATAPQLLIFGVITAVMR